MPLALLAALAAYFRERDAQSRLLTCRVEPAGYRSLNWDVFPKQVSEGMDQVFTQRKEKQVSITFLLRLTALIESKRTFSFTDLTVLWVFINAPDGSRNDLV